ncbi:MAG TPA: papain-like cysteine protease family protein [Bryobacteraceae bacterium]|nr:papain-like cysteine protease family protein [Bryobacteraceae bacterium]
MAITIGSSVGSGGTNKSSDVKAIQTALNEFPMHWGGPVPKLSPDGVCGDKTIAAIKGLQVRQFGWLDGKVSAGGVTLQRINAMLDTHEKPGLPTAYKIRWQMSFPFVGQVKSMGCWAATAAMMLSMHDRKQYTLEDILTKADGGSAGKFHLAFAMDTGLKWEYNDEFSQKLGFKREGLKSFPITTFATWLRSDAVGLTLEFKNRVHIVCLHGLIGDGTEYGTAGFGYDPWGSSFGYSWRTLRGQFELVDHKSIWRF